jgi:sugar transferase (PEP-CTERM/EpsH1 system associated)
MRDLLFLCHRIPYPPDKGDKIRAFHILQHLRASFHIHLGCFIDNPADEVHVEALSKMVQSLCCVKLQPGWAKYRALTKLRPGMPLSVAFYTQHELASWVLRTSQTQQIDQIFAFSAVMAPYADLVPSAPRLLDMVDIDSQKFSAYAAQSSWPARAFWAREARTLLAFERAAASRFDHVLFVSQAERYQFVDLAPEAAGHVSAVGNGVDLQYFTPAFHAPSPFGERPAIVFTGAMDYRPNIDAVRWFATMVMPALRRRAVPPIFYIVGANPAPSVNQLAAEADIIVTGRVPDTRPYLAHAALVIAPLQIARGIQNKVLEAMAMAKPVIASPAAFAGIEAIAPRDILVAEGGEAFTHAAHNVLDGQYPDLGTHARAAMEQRYDWPQALAPLDDVLGGPSR